LDLEGLTQFHTYSDPERDPRFHTVSTVFIAEGKGTPQAGSDAGSFKIVKLSNLLKLDYAFDHKKIIQDYLKYKKK
ncbi:MAG: NUDIX hydrolase, partial [Candidatus Omnitrophica bacterium]|nr:NUDIX hydrolase [Candidatus Omnitrophota bacterium]